MKYQLRKRTVCHAKTDIILQEIQQILTNYKQAGIHQTTVRNIYYKLLGKGLLTRKNTKKTPDNKYEQASEIITKGKYWGVLDWDAIVDTSRPTYMNTFFADIPDGIQYLSKKYQLDRWENQFCYVELFTEKDTLTTQLLPISKKYQVRYTVNRGNTSSTNIYETVNRFRTAHDQNKTCVALYLGDYDPSGMRMSEQDFPDRLQEFNVEFISERISLTMQQIKKYNLAKYGLPLNMKDSNARWYQQHCNQEFGWEIDALDSVVLRDIVEVAIQKYLDIESYNTILKQEAEHKVKILDMIDTV